MKSFYLCYCAASVIMGAFLAWLGGTAVTVLAAWLFFMAGAFFERAYPGGIAKPATRRKGPRP